MPVCMISTMCVTEMVIIERVRWHAATVERDVAAAVGSGCPREPLLIALWGHTLIACCAWMGNDCCGTDRSFITWKVRKCLHRHIRCHTLPRSWFNPRSNRATFDSVPLLETAVRQQLWF